MDERILQWRVGVVVVAAGILVLILMLVVQGWSIQELFERKYTLYINFPQAPGVNVDTPIRRDGVVIGRVHEVRLMKRQGVQIVARIDGHRELSDSQVCRINSQFPLGNAVLEFVPTALTGVEDAPLVDGDVIEGVVGVDPMQTLANMESDLSEAVQSISRAASEATLLVRNANQALGNNADQLRRVLIKSESAIDEFQAAMRGVSGVFGDEQLRSDLNQALADIPELVQETRDTMQKARTTLDSFAETGESFREVGESARRNLENIESFTAALGEQGPVLLGDLRASTSGLDAMIDEFTQMARAVNSSEGTVGMLLHDPDLYLRLNAAAGNIEDASRRIRPILDNVSIITDKIARDPGGSVGVKSILDRSPSGLKFGFGPDSDESERFRPTAVFGRGMPDEPVRMIHER